jgi:hypothetical protein
MSTTLTYNAVTVTLPDDMIWSDEYDWHPIVQSSEFTTTGALLIESAMKQAGRPISLNNTEDQAWLTKAICDQIKTWASLPGIALTLVYRGVTHSVVFDHEKTAFEAYPLVFYRETVSGDYYIVNIRFIEV